MPGFRPLSTALTEATTWSVRSAESLLRQGDAIVFDVNETLLDMGILDDTLGEIFGGADHGELRKKRFEQELELLLRSGAQQPCHGHGLR